MKKLLPVMILAFSAALFGALAGGVSAGFLHLVDWGQRLLWETLTSSLPLQTLLVCTVGGLLVGLCQRYLGNYPKGINEAIAEIRKTGRMEYKHLHKGLVTAGISLIFGASLGPEAALMDLFGGLGTWIVESIRSLRMRFKLSAPPKSKNKLVNLLNQWPNWLALAAGMLVLVRLLNSLYGGGFLNLGEPFAWNDLLWSIPLGLAGAAAGWLYLTLQNQTSSLAAPLKTKPVLRSLLGGIILGGIALFLPLVLFSGQHALQQTYDQAAQLGFWTLFLTGMARLFLTGLLLATGWKGGQFLPIMFGSTALGLSFSILFPSIPAPAAAIGTMAGMIAVVLPNPLIALVLMVLMFPIQYAGISIAAIGTVIVAQKAWKAIAARRLTAQTARAIEEQPG